ncbi:phage holin, lambda family [Pseudomonas sp. CM27]|uniref:phage holin, lambda family n=1 Tax=Pseudomonas sp. CM27 TaxID=2738452 RepID=UPI0015573765|nr:phage holin, lambda family [Pseudomonas sp. CM27]NQD72932.1 phage holin, lambda family [Pseudomonas sp. CM27]
MPNMPEKDPSLWAAVLTGVLAHQPQLGAAGLSVAIAVLRVVYGGGTRRQMFLEGALCGLITLALVPLLEWMGLPQGMATFAGGMVGFMGVEKLRVYSDLFLSRKAQG